MKSEFGDASVVSVSFFVAGGILTGLVIVLLVAVAVVVVVSVGKMEERGTLLRLLLNWWMFPSVVVAALWGVVVAGSTAAEGTVSAVGEVEPSVEGDDWR
jgi:hypothetical protein